MKTVIIAVLLIAAGSAQALSYSSSRIGGTTFYSGGISGSTQHIGNSSFGSYNTDRGSMNCTTQRIGSQSFTSCN